MKYTVTCEHCQKETHIGYEEWLALTEVMLTFASLDKAQKDLILLLCDGLKWRQNNQKPIDAIKATGGAE